MNSRKNLREEVWIAVVSTSKMGIRSQQARSFQRVPGALAWLKLIQNQEDNEAQSTSGLSNQFSDQSK